MKKDFEHQTEYDEPDEDEVIDPANYEPDWIDRVLVICAVIWAATALLFMFSGGKLP